jgi:aquaporin Z
MDPYPGSSTEEIEGESRQRLPDVSPLLVRALFGTAPAWVRDFSDRSHEWRRMAAEVVGTFLLVLVAAGGAVVNSFGTGAIDRDAQVVAPALMVMAVILAIGATSGAHLNPVVSVAFALRREFPWRRIPGYVAAQMAGGLLACLFLWAPFGKIGTFGATVPGAHVTDFHAMLLEAVLTFGLITTILGTASGAQNVGPLSALRGRQHRTRRPVVEPDNRRIDEPGPLSAPDVILLRLGHYWVYLVGPTIGMLTAVAVAYVLRGPGADPIAASAAQGSLGAAPDTRTSRRDRPPV